MENTTSASSGSSASASDALSNLPISHTQILALDDLLASQKESPPRRRKAQSSSPPSQPESPRSISSSPERPNPLSSKRSRDEYNIYTVQNNKLLAEEIERMFRVKFGYGETRRTAVGKDLDMQILVLQAIDKLSVVRLRRLAVWLIKSGTLVKKWLERELDVENVDEGVIGNVLSIKLMELIDELVRTNRSIRKWMAHLLLDRKEDGSFEFKKFDY
ncbi:hypothetical protein NHQ30_008756 [Ciborinia camelliae]|nr:hypothetical protein NHQ30_008756 [Ciborinia camelliae]